MYYRKDDTSESCCRGTRKEDIVRRRRKEGHDHGDHDDGAINNGAKECVSGGGGIGMYVGAYRDVACGKEFDNSRSGRYVFANRSCPRIF